MTDLIQNRSLRLTGHGSYFATGNVILSMLQLLRVDTRG